LDKTFLRRNYFNIVIFTTALCSALSLRLTGIYDPALTNLFNYALLFFACAATLALGMCVYKREQIPGVDTALLSLRTGRILRGVAMTMPFLLLLAAILNFSAWSACDSVKALWTRTSLLQVSLNTADKAQIKEALNYAAKASPYNIQILKTCSKFAFLAGFYEDAYFYARKARQICKGSECALILEWQALKRLPEKQAQFSLIASEVERLYPVNSGESWHQIAQIEMENLNYQDALSAAESHLTLHPSESSAYRQRAQILAALGESKKAEADLAVAKQIEGKN